MAGNVGRPPKPTALKLIEGNRGKRPLNTGEINPRVQIPRCPSHLSPEAKREWKRISPELRALGLISEIDAAALALYCDAYGRWQQAAKMIKQLRGDEGDGLIITSPNGYPMQSPYVAIANTAMQQCYQFLQQFGMSPSARARVSASNQLELFPDDDHTGSGAERYFSG